MRPRITLTVLTGFAVIAALTGMLAPVPASAHGARSNVLTTFHLLETNNPSVYLTTDGVTPYGKAETGSRPGRDVMILQTGNTYQDPAGLCHANPDGNCDVYILELGSGYCLGSDNIGYSVEIRDCSSLFDLWALVAPGSVTTDDLWINVTQSQAAGYSQLMAGTRATGNVITLCSWYTYCTGLYTNWNAA